MGLAIVGVVVKVAVAVVAVLLLLLLLLLLRLPLLPPVVSPWRATPAKAEPWRTVRRRRRRRTRTRTEVSSGGQRSEGASTRLRSALRLVRTRVHAHCVTLRGRAACGQLLGAHAELATDELRDEIRRFLVWLRGLAPEQLAQVVQALPEEERAPIVAHLAG